MKYFEIVKSALDALIVGICVHKNLTHEQASAMVGKHLETMSKEWFSGDTPNIAYGDPLCRFAYLYSHTAVNANLCEDCIRSVDSIGVSIIDRLNKTGELRVCAFGGGPGTELLALSKYLCGKFRKGKLKPGGELNFTLLDSVPEWGESWNALESAIKKQFATEFGHRRDWPFSISKSFYPYDMNKVSQYSNLVQLFEQDLYLMNYVLSEIFADHKAFGALVGEMAKHAPAGAVFAIIDRKQAKVTGWAKELFKAAGIKEVEFYETSTNMDGDEQKMVLGQYEKFIKRTPRITWNGAFCLAGVKP